MLDKKILVALAIMATTFGGYMINKQGETTAEPAFLVNDSQMKTPQEEFQMFKKKFNKVY